MQSTEDFFAQCDDLVLREILKHIGDDPLTLRLLRATCKRWRELVTFDNDIPRIANESIMRVRRENIVWWARKLVSRNDFDAFRLLLREFIGSHRFEQTGLDFARFSSRILRKTLGAQDDRFARELLPYCTFNGERADARMTTKLWSEQAGAKMIRHLLLIDYIIARMFVMWGNDRVRAFIDECNIFPRKIDWDKPFNTNPDSWTYKWYGYNDRVSKRMRMIYAIRREIARGTVTNMPTRFVRYTIDIFRESTLSDSSYICETDTFLKLSLSYLDRCAASSSCEISDNIVAFKRLFTRFIREYFDELHYDTELSPTSSMYHRVTPEFAQKLITRFAKFAYFRECVSEYYGKPFAEIYRKLIASVDYCPQKWDDVLFRARYHEFALDTITSDREIQIHQADDTRSIFAFKTYNRISRALFERILAKIYHITNTVVEQLMRAIAIGRINHTLRYPTYIARAFAAVKMREQCSIISLRVINYDFLYDDYRRKKLTNA